MVSFVIRRLLISIPVVLLSSVLVFLLVANSGDPLSELKSRQPPVPQEVIKAREHALYLDRSEPVRYGIWISHFVRGDMGTTLDGRDVRTLLGQRLPVTLRMISLAMLLALILGVGVGVVSAVKQYTPTDYTFTFFGFLFLSMPVFWLAALLKEFLAIRVNQALGRVVFFTVGDQTPNLAGNLVQRLGNYAGHLVLPTVTLALITFASWSRYQRGSMLEVLSSDYIRMARAKGLSRSRVMLRHALRNALIPLVTVAAIDIGALFGGAVITENVFSWHGMGELLINGVTIGDVNVVLAWLMVTAIIVILFNLLADVLYAVLDPRIRYG
ncbi:MAG TPA: ABC transporter permease [Actinomycetota bacterium]